MWADKSQLATAIDLMNKNGFENVDSSVFVRNKTANLSVQKAFGCISIPRRYDCSGLFAFGIVPKALAKSASDIPS